MKKLAGLCCSIAMVIAFSAIGFSQTDNSGNTGDGLQITAREVSAVQYELSRRGYYKEKPTGVLDRATRDAVRRFQADNGLAVTGRIDQQTYQKLELVYPATGDEGDNQRRSGILPKIGYGVKDTVTNTGKTITGTAVKVKETANSGLEKTWDTGAEMPEKTKEAAGSLGEATVDGLKSAGRKTQRASSTLIGRSDAEVHREVREILNQDSQTEKWTSSVKDGLVTLKTTPNTRADVGEVVSKLRKVAGVKSVFVIAQ